MRTSRLRFRLIIFFGLCFLTILGWGYTKFRSLPDERVLGEWKVDTVATLKDWEARQPLSEQRKLFWAETWEDYRLTWYKDRYTTLFRDDSSRVFYKVRKRGADKLVILESGKPAKQKVIHFAGEGRIWIEFAEGSEKRQYFKRVSTKPAGKESKPALALVLGQ